MTDTSPRPLKVTTCYDPTGRTVSCYALVEDTDETRREHRLWHKHEESVKDGLRSAIKERDDTIAAFSRQLEDVGRDVKGIEIPEAVLGIEINRDGWTDDLDDTDPVEDTPEPEAPATYIDPVTGLTMTGTPPTHINPSALYTPTTSTLT